MIRLKSWQWFILATPLVTFLETFSPSVYAVTLITEETALEANDILNWSSLGKVFDFSSPNPADFLSNSFSAQSSQGLGINVEIPPANSPSITPPLVFQTLPRGIETNFASGDFILFTGLQPGSFPATGNPGPISLTFDNPVFAVGTQIAVDDTFVFTATISAFDSNDNLLGTFSADGTSTIELDNSALFLGVSSDLNNISKIIYSSLETDRAIGINDLRLTVANVSVPEGSLNLGLLTLGIGGIIDISKKFIIF